MSGAGDHLAAIDADAELELRTQARVLFGKTFAQGEGCAHRALRVIVVSVWDAEHCHDRVADELLDRAPVELEDLA